MTATTAPRDREVRWPDGALYRDRDGATRFTLARARVIAQVTGGTIHRAGPRP